MNQTEEGVIGKKGWFANLADRILSNANVSSLITQVTNQLTEKGIEFATSPKGIELLQKLAASEAGQKLVSQLPQLFADKVLGPAAERLIARFTASTAGGDGSVSIERILSQFFALQENPAVSEFIHSTVGAKVITAFQNMGEGGIGVMVGKLQDEAFRKWLENNTPPLHPQTRGVPQSILEVTTNPDEISLYRCGNCEREYRAKPDFCVSCQGTSIIGYHSVPNEQWETMMQEFRTWEKRASEVKSTVKQDGMVGLGAALATTTADDLHQLMKGALSGMGIASEPSDGAKQMVKDTLAGNTGYYEIRSNGPVEDVAADSELHNRSKGELYRLLQHAVAANPQYRVSNKSSMREPVATQQLILSAGIGTTITQTALAQTVYCNDTRNNPTLQAPLIILGEILGSKVPATRIGGALYFVLDEELGLGTDKRSKIANLTDVKFCTIRKAFQMVQEHGLVPA